MERNTKFLVGALVILLVCLVVFNTNLTGDAFLRFSRLKYIFAKPASTITAPPSVPCTDSDGGYIIRTKGICRGILPESGIDDIVAGARSDSCADTAELIEWYCEKGKCVSKRVNCWEERGLNSTCSDGACILIGPGGYPG